MKHCKTGRQFGRVRSQRKALMNSLLSSLIIYGRIETTEAKAKETNRFIDKLITKAKRADGDKVEIARKLESELSKEALQKIMINIDKFNGRDSGYARVIKLSPRKSDSARMAIIELIDLTVEKVEKKSTKSTKKVAKKVTKEVVDEKSTK